jgi:hypothetical protein
MINRFVTGRLQKFEIRVLDTLVLSKNSKSRNFASLYELDETGLRNLQRVHDILDKEVKIILKSHSKKIPQAIAKALVKKILF